MLYRLAHEQEKHEPVKQNTPTTTVIILHTAMLVTHRMARKKEEKTGHDGIS